MKKITLASVLFVLLVGCSSEPSFSEVNLEDVHEDARSVFENIGPTDDAPIYYDGEDIAYIFLHGNNEDNKLFHFTDFSVESDGNNLMIYYTQEETNDSSDNTLKYQVVYKINKEKEYERVRVFKNREEAEFYSVPGN
ncbi:hypothetical protein ACERII_22785 [Evansella sp. AB-rgal1]|uniref:hypothetical protein n=1 Tax=Evansella sp. AB-rgal1 TaxID=3242696 RepID=UPI00359E41B5